MIRMLIFAALLCAVATQVSAQGQFSAEFVNSFFGTNNRFGLQLALSNDIDTVAASEFVLRDASGNEYPAFDMVQNHARLFLYWHIDAHSYQFFENFVEDSSGVAVVNLVPLRARSHDAVLLAAGGLETATLGKISVPAKQWKKYILNAYAQYYLFPHKLNFLANHSLADSAKMAYGIELQQSDSYFSSGALTMYWGLRGHWTTDALDALNYAEIYPLVFQYASPSLRANLLLGVESGAEGFAKLGRGVAGLSVAARVPYNPVDLTFGNRRIRPFPLLNLTVKPVLYWSDHTLPDSLRNALELTPAITYNIPVGENLYLQVNAEGTYSTLPMQHYRYAYDVGLGYITDGNIQIVAKYQQGNGLSGLTYDKRLLLGIALETLNLARGR